MRIFVGCSSSNDIPNKYKKDCKVLINELFKSNYDLVFGACNDGIMGYAYNAALKNKRKIIGICTENYKEDLQKLKCTTEIITSSVNERTEKLINISDVLLFLPGGIGTIHELFSSIDSKRCNEHNKTIIIYNSNNYFNETISLLEKIYNENFTNSTVKNNYIVINNKEEILTYINNIKDKVK